MTIGEMLQFILNILGVGFLIAICVILSLGARSFIQKLEREEKEKKNL